MITNKTLGNLTIASVALAMFGGILEGEAYETAQTLYMVAGLGMIVFGIWAGVRLNKLPDQVK